MGNGKVYLIATLITALVFVIRERKNINRLLRKRGESKKYSNNVKEIQEIMEREGVSFDKASEIFATQEIIKVINITYDKWDLGNGRILKQGDMVSFVDEEVGYIQGKFFGLIEPKAVGYGNLYILRKPDNTFRQAPIAYIKKDTINIYN